MKSIKEQYIALTEGNMSKANFMRNLRMTLPQYITNVTSFDDSVKILKNKGILTEADINELDVHNFAGNPEEEASARQNVKQFAKREEEWVAVEKPNGEILKRFPSHKEAQDWVDDVDPLGMYNLNIRPDSNLKEGKKSLKEGRFAEIDTLNAQEVLIGIDCEMQKGKNKKDAAKIVIKNLRKNPNYYTAYALSGVEGAKAEYMNKFKPGSDQMKPIKGGSLVDKDNGVKSPKNIEKTKASSNKAKKETVKVEKITLMSLVPKSLRGVAKMNATGEKMKKLSLKENEEKKSLEDIAQEIYDVSETNGLDSNERYEILKTYNLSDKDNKEVEYLIFQMRADERYDDGDDELDETTALPGGDNVTDLDGEMMDTSTNDEIYEVKAGHLKVGETFNMSADLGKFVKGEEVTVVSITPEGDDIKIVITNGKDEDDFYIDKNDEL